MGPDLGGRDEFVLRAMAVARPTVVVVVIL
jgi:hypothetical protein